MKSRMSATDQLALYKECEGVSRNKLARLLDIDVKTMKRIEEGESVPNVNQAVKLRDLAGIEVEDWEVR